MALVSETIALPVTKGLDVQTDARLVEPPALLEAENTQFSGGGAKKRRGHVEYQGRGPSAVYPNPPASLQWVFGAGLLASGQIELGAEDTLYALSSNPEQTQFSGVATRDEEILPWNGHQLLSYLPSDSGSQAVNLASVSPAVMPSLTMKDMAKANEHQTYPEFADTGTIRIMAWISGTSVKYSLSDTVSSALIASGTLTTTSPVYLRAFTLGDWIHLMVLDAGKAVLYSLYSKEPGTITTRSYGQATHFDLWKVSESRLVFVRSFTDGLHVTWISTTGTGDGAFSPIAYVPSLTGVPGLVAIASMQPTTTTVGLAWKDTTNNRICVAMLSQTGTVIAEQALATSTNAVRLTLTSRGAITSVGNGAIFDAFWDDGTNIYSNRFWHTGGSVITLGVRRTRYHALLASRAFPVGCRTYLWAGHSSTIQASWFLLDEGLLPVGRVEFGLANVSGLGSTGRIAGVNWLMASPYEVQLALDAKLRVVPNDSAQATAAIYTEPHPKAVHLDFLPSLRFAQAGRCTYFAGAQVWCYDGKQLVESGFHLGPEPVLVPSNGGALTALGTYSYRVDLCHRNAQNEEVRSLSILSNSLVLTGSQATITLTIPTVLTRRTDSYFLIFRNAMEAGTPLTEWWLLNSRDPADASYRANDLGVSSVTFVDSGAIDDTAIQTRELHPATDTYIQPISAPACEIIASGRDRLWVAGGELPVGVVAPSRLFDPGEVPTFNPYLNIQVDRAVQAITALGFIGEVAVIFREGSTHMLDSDGPDNVANGLWAPPRLALADLGAVSQAGLARISQGLVFQSLAGFRLLGAGGALSPIGVEVDKRVKDFEVVGSVISEKDQEIRFYGSATDGTYVLNYLYGTWAHWTCGGVGVAKNSTGFGLIAREDGKLWVETEGTWKDGAATYTHRIRTSWLHGGNLGDFQRIRTVGGLGRYADTALPSHDLRVEFYYDEREFWEERVDWAMPDSSSDQSTWGEDSWGAGVWGDTNATISNLSDSTWEWNIGPSRQKCGVFSVALEDIFTDGPGFVLSAFSFELARKHGLNRVPARDGTGTYRT